MQKTTNLSRTEISKPSGTHHAGAVKINGYEMTMLRNDLQSTQLSTSTKQSISQYCLWVSSSVRTSFFQLLLFKSILFLFQSKLFRIQLLCSLCHAFCLFVYKTCELLPVASVSKYSSAWRCHLLNLAVIWHFKPFWVVNATRQACLTKKMTFICGSRA